MTLGPSGTLRFGAHNLALRSETPATASWTGVRSTITNSATTTYDSQSGIAFSVVEDSSTNTHFAQHNLSGTVVGNTYEYTFEVKAAGRGFIAAVVYDGAADNGVYINLSTGAIGANYGSGNAGITATDLGGGWYRVRIPWTQVSGTTSIIYVWLASASGTVSYAGDGASGVYAARPHVRRTPSDSTYLATTSAARYALPYEWDSNGNNLGILVEEARTNLLTYSEQINNAAWTKTGASISANAVAAPDGQTTADKIVEDSATSLHYIIGAPFVAAAATTFSVYAKQAGRTWITLWTDAVGGAGKSARFDIANGTIGTVDASFTAAITALPSGWYRCAITFTSTNALSRQMIVSLATGDGTGNQSYAGDGSSGVYLWGAQCETGSFPTSYIPTFSAAVSRAADNISLATSAFPYSTTEGMLYAAYDKLSFAVRGDAAGYAGGGSTTLGLFHGAGTAEIRWFARDSASNADNLQLASGLSTGTLIKAAGAYKGGDSAGSANGAAAVAGSTASGSFTTGATAVGIAQGTPSFNTLNGHLRQLMYLPRRMSNADLQALTT